MRLDASSLGQASLRPEPLLVGEIVDQRDIGHDPILSDEANIASPDLLGAAPYPIGIVRFVSDGTRIREARKAAGLSQTELGDAMGVTQSVVSNWETGELQSWRDVAEKLAKVLGKPSRYFATEPESLAETKGIQVVGEVQAGAFKRALEIPPGERATINVLPPRGYERLQLCALKVVGPSMDLLYPDGSHVIVASVFDTDVRHGDRVVVYQSQGELREATIKEVRLETDGRIGLWPRSTHPDHQAPIYLEESDQDGPEIAYVVVARYQDEERPPAPIQLPKRRRA